MNRRGHTRLRELHGVEQPGLVLTRSGTSAAAALAVRGAGFRIQGAGWVPHKPAAHAQIRPWSALSDAGPLHHIGAVLYTVEWKQAERLAAPRHFVNVARVSHYVTQHHQGRGTGQDRSRNASASFDPQVLDRSVRRERTDVRALTSADRWTRYSQTSRCPCRIENPRSTERRAGDFLPHGRSCCTQSKIVSRWSRPCARLPSRPVERRPPISANAVWVDAHLIYEHLAGL